MRRSLLIVAGVVLVEGRSIKHHAEDREESRVHSP
jgi:hypothetical protein